MSHLQNILQKLNRFIRKFYVNELIKGCIFFFSLGLLYLIFTLAIEHFLWLSKGGRTVLFWLFIVAEISLLYRFVFTPLLRLKGIKKGITELEASKIIGDHFPEVKDKLLNLIQLKNSSENSDLIVASIAQKSKQLKPFTFRKAVDYGTNKRYLKYALIPLVVLVLFEWTNRGNFILDSANRIVHYNSSYAPPAPFSFVLENESLDVIQGEGITLNIKTVGEERPDQATIHFNDASYYLAFEGGNSFSFSIQSISESFNFQLSAGNVNSDVYYINCIPTPLVTNLKMILKYPDYTGRTAEVIQNTGNAMVPQGSEISWQIETNQVDQLELIIEDKDSLSFERSGNDYYNLSKRLMRSMNYKISTTNSYLKNHESLPFYITVVEDRYPKIVVESGIDTLAFGPAEFNGELSDDYGIQKLEMVYFDRNDEDNLQKLTIPVVRSNTASFYYIFPDRISVEEGINYELYFEVYDNDGVNGSKKTRSRTYRYYQPTKEELRAELLKDQQETIDNISRSLEEFNKSKEEMNAFEDELRKKGVINWNDGQKMEDFMERQAQYEEMFERQTNDLEENIDALPENEKTEQTKEALKERLKEAKELAERNKLLEQLDSLANKLGRENMLDKLEELSRKNQQNKQSLERLLELTKRFYVEQKMAQVSQKLNELSEKEETLSDSQNMTNDSIMKMQNELNEDFEEIKKELDELDKENAGLQKPMSVPEHKEAGEEIEETLKEAMEKLQNNETNDARKKQKSAARKMKKLAEEFDQQMMQMEGESLNENIDDLRKIVENLIEYSFRQEALMERFRSTDNDHPEYPKNLREQQVLKEYFEHIDDSLYVLSMRVASMSMAIQQEVNDVHYFMENALNNFAENRFGQGLADQQFMITGANNLANMLSNLLENMMNASMRMGQGSGDQEFKLPDIIQKQGELQQRMEEGKNKEGENGADEMRDGGDQEGSEQMNGELYEIYKEQVQLREALQKMMGEDGKKPGNEGSDVIEEMEMLEELLLDKGFSQEVIERIQKLQYELLKLDTAEKEQGKDKDRKSESAEQSHIQRVIERLKLENKNKAMKERLIRQSLPLRSIYKEKAEDYFKKQKDSIE